MKTSRFTAAALTWCAAAAFVVATLAPGADARTKQGEVRRFTSLTPNKGLPAGSSPQSLNVAAAATTTYLANYKFNTGASCVTQGWISHDLTEQGDYVHVDDFAGLGGGTYGLLTPITGAKSLWIGARPNTADPELCSYLYLPGYANNWIQPFCSDCFALTGDATLTFDARWDAEDGWDYAYVEIDAGCGDTWTRLTTSTPFTGQGSSSESIMVPAAQHGGSARFRFIFYSDTGFSDADGGWDGDGAFIVDNVKIVDNAGTQTNETFEAETVGAHATTDGQWQSCVPAGYGSYAGLLPGASLLQQDPCTRDLSCVWTFIVGSTANWACGGFPGVTAVPFGNDRGQYISNEVWSPTIAWTGTGTQASLDFDTYRDLPLDNLIFYQWHVRSIAGLGNCPGVWKDLGYVYYGEEKDWLADSYSIGPLIDPGTTDVQIAVGVFDYCKFYCGQYSGACHSHSPMIDNVRLIRIAVDGPQWQVQGLDLFQDNFATDGTVTGTVRADEANDVLPASHLASVLPGDSAAAVVIDPVNGLAIDPGLGGAAVYAYVKVSPTQPAKTGAPLSDNPSRWPVVGTTVGPDGDTWTIVRFDTSYTAQGNPFADTYCVDLNDNLFVPGDTVEYFFAAESGNGAHSYFFHQSRAADNGDAVGAIRASTDINVAYANATEFTCLPAAALNNGGDILYVDDGDGRSVQPWFDQAFKFLGIYDKVDRYDVLAPTSTVSNGPGSRVTNIAQQILPYYKKIIWNSEELDAATISDGNPDKSDDFGLLYTFIDQSTLDPGLYISGDGIPSDWVASPAPAAVNLRSAYLNFDLVTADHKTVGLGTTPKAIAAPGSFFTGVGPDTMVVYGGCFGINRFDVTHPTGTAVAEMNFAGNPLYAASISQTTLNGSGHTARVLLEGFSYDLIRDDRAGANGGVMDRVDHLYDIITWLQNSVDQPTGVPATAFKTTLSQNYPNPFNPSTTIEFTVRDRSRVSLKIYNVAGQLVRTLVDEERAPGTVHQVAWDGRNQSGQSVSSGVYFYKLATSDMTQTRKMVLLK